MLDHSSAVSCNQWEALVLLQVQALVLVRPRVPALPLQMLAKVPAFALPLPLPLPLQL